MTYIRPQITILDFTEDDNILQSSPHDDSTPTQKVNVTFQTIVNTDYDDKIEIEL